MLWSPQTQLEMSNCFTQDTNISRGLLIKYPHSGHSPAAPARLKKKKKNPFTLFYIYHLWPGLHGCWLAAVNPRGWGFIACQVMKVCNISTLVKVLTSPVLKKKHTLSRYGVAENEIQFTFHEYIANVLWRYSVFIRSVSLIVLRKSVIQATLCFLNLV